MYTTYYIFSITLLSLATTDRQDLTHNEEQPGHMKVHHNEEQPGHMKVHHNVSHEGTSQRRAARSHHNEEQPGHICLLYTSPSPRDMYKSRMPSSA